MQHSRIARGTLMLAVLASSACGASAAPGSDGRLRGLAQEAGQGARDAASDGCASEDGDGQAADAGPEDEDAGAVARLVFIVPGPSGSGTTLTAQVPAEGPGDIVIQAYPDEVELALRHSTLPVAYEGAFSREFCEDVRRIAQLADRGEPFRQRADTMLRRTGSVTAQLPLSPWVGATFEARAVDAARARREDLASARLVNPLELETARIELVLTDDAITHHLGAAGIQQRLDAALQARRAQALATGSLTLALAGKDVWCDLAEGRATLQVAVTGSAGDEAYHGTTWVRGVEAL